MKTLLSFFLLLCLCVNLALAKDELPRRPYFGAKVEAVSDSLRAASQIKFEGGLNILDRATVLQRTECGFASSRYFAFRGWNQSFRCRRAFDNHQGSQNR